MGGSSFDEYKPCLAMVVAQCIYAIMALTAKASFSHGMSPMIFVVYRQVIATLVLLPTTILAKGGRISEMGLGMEAFCLVFVASLVGATINQYLNYEGLRLASSSMATAMGNLTPAITFVMAASIGLEKVKVKSLRSMAKIVGTIICVGGAVSMAFLKGPKLLNTDYQNLITLLHSVSDEWIKGCLFLIGGSCCWSSWLIMQVPICKSYLDPLTLSAWMCLLSTFQSAILTFFLQPDLGAWKITSFPDLFCCMFAGIFGSGVTFYLQSWSIAARGPLYSAMFNPLNTVITTVFASLILHEELHAGSLIGALAVVGGLYVVLWGKAKDLETKGKPGSSDDQTKITITIDSQSDNCGNDMTEPLLTQKSNREN